MKRSLRKLLQASLLIAFVAALGLGVQELGRFARQSEAVAAGAKTGPVADNLKDIFVELSKRLVPSVVNIYTTQTVQSPYGGPQAELYRRFFEQFFGEEFGEGEIGRAHV